MIIDFHTHTFPDRIAGSAIDHLSRSGHVRPWTDGTNRALTQSMRRAGIDCSVILPVATSPSQVEKVNNSSAALSEAWEKEGLISFGCIHPDYDGYYAELGRIKALGLKGIKIHPVYQGVDIDDIRYLRILDRAAQLGLLVTTHAGEDIGFPGAVRCSPAMCRHVVDEIGDFGFILAHMGGWNNWREVPEYLQETGVFLDTSFSTGQIRSFEEDPEEPSREGCMLDEEGFLHLVDVFGADRILFGTDCPWSGQSESVEAFQKLHLTQEQKERILSGNAIRLLGLQG